MPLFAGAVTQGRKYLKTFQPKNFILLGILGDHTSFHHFFITLFNWFPLKSSSLAKRYSLSPNTYHPYNSAILAYLRSFFWTTVYWGWCTSSSWKQANSSFLFHSPSRIIRETTFQLATPNGECGREGRWCRDLLILLDKNLFPIANSLSNPFTLHHCFNDNFLSSSWEEVTFSTLEEFPNSII